MSNSWNTIRRLHRETTLGAKESIMFRYVSRPLASLFLFFIKDRAITPNQVTLISLFVGICGALILGLWTSYWALIVAGVLFVLAHVLDALDGQLARYRKQGSSLGHALDFFIDELKAWAILVAVSLRLALQAETEGSGFMPISFDFLANPLSLWPTQFATNPLTAVAIGGLGAVGLGAGLGCTRFLRHPAWQEAFSQESKGSEGTDNKKSLLGRILGIGRFLVDYPSHLPLLLLLNRLDVFLPLYAVALLAHCFRSVLLVSYRAWRIAPPPPTATEKS